MKKKILTAATIIIVLSVFLGCAATSREVSKKPGRVLVDISTGLPTEGLWRQNIALYDMNGDGFLDIVAPPPRKAKKGQARPFIFLWNPLERKWAEGKYVFPEKSYSYGGIAVGDIDGDGYPDIVLAQHARKGGITLLLNDKRNGFVERPVNLAIDFRSRAVVLSDINGDGRLDIIALSEAPFSENYKPLGLFVALNSGEGEWRWNTIGTSAGLYGDSVALGDLRGSGKKDIAAALLTGVKEDQKLLWLADSKGDFSSYAGDLLGENLIPLIVRTGDIDGDGKEEAIFSVAEIGSEAATVKGKFAVMKWTGDGFEDISSGLDPDFVMAMDVADIDGDGRAEIIALTVSGIHIYKFNGMSWFETEHFALAMEDVANATDLRVGRNKDGSVLIAFGNGKYAARHLKEGIKAYILK